VNALASSPAVSQRGMALVTSLLLLIIITILALSMFRSFGTQEKIAGNLREKERALHAAESAQQYGEWWLLQANNTAIGGITCPNAAPLSANAGEGQICGTAGSMSLENLFGFTGVTSPLPWPVQYTTYLPPGMSVTPGTNGASGDPPYAAVPGFYIADLGVAADGKGEAYQIDAYGFGGATATVAVVESTYEVTQGVSCRSCP
jgi:type IV pilus assembly protein PilX